MVSNLPKEVSVTVDKLAGCADYKAEPAGLHPWTEEVCQFWGRAGCIVDGRTCKWEGKPPTEEVVGVNYSS
jgi:hypothetical protein